MAYTPDRSSTTITADDGFPLAMQVAGPSSAPALFLLQGQANSHSWWDGLREAFETDFRTITIDYRGTGGSRELESTQRTGPGNEANETVTDPTGEWSTTRFARDAIAALDHLGIERAAVYGTSMGGRIAQMLALDFPERVSALVLGCTSPGGPHAVKRPREVGQTLARLSGDERVKYLHSLFYTPDWPCGPKDSNLLGDPTMSTAESAAHLRISAKHNAWDRLPEIVAPTLITHGSEDRMNPVENATLLASRIPHSRLLIHPEGRHGFFEEYAEVVNTGIRDFLSEVNGR